MNIFYVMLAIYNFFHDNGVKISIPLFIVAWLDIDVTIKLIGVVPGAIYICFKIWKEHIKPLFNAKKP